MKENIDELDKAILRLMQENADRPQKQIANLLNRSPATICERIKKLVKNTYITGNSAILNRKLLNINVQGIIHLNLINHSEEEVLKFKTEINKIKGVCECVKMVGKYNFQIKIATTDITSFSAIEKLISTLKNVRDTVNSIIVEDIIKDKGIDF